MKKWRANQHLYKQPVICTSTLDKIGGFLMMYAPHNDDFGMLTTSSNTLSTGGDSWFECVMQVFLDHDAKVIALGHGYMTFRKTFQSPRSTQSFESPTELDNSIQLKYDEIVTHLQQIFPKYQIIPWSSEFVMNNYKQNSIRIDAILEKSALPNDISSEILKHLLPKWPSKPLMLTDSDLGARRKLLNSWSNLWLSTLTQSRRHYKLLPHRWRYWYVYDLNDIVDNCKANWPSMA